MSGARSWAAMSAESGGLGLTRAGTVADAVADAVAGAVADAVADGIPGGDPDASAVGNHNSSASVSVFTLAAAAASSSSSVALSCRDTSAASAETDRTGAREDSSGSAAAVVIADAVVDVTVAIAGSVALDETEGARSGVVEVDVRASVPCMTSKTSSRSASSGPQPSCRKSRTRMAYAGLTAAWRCKAGNRCSALSSVKGICKRAAWVRNRMGREGEANGRERRTKKCSSFSLSLSVACLGTGFLLSFLSCLPYLSRSSWLFRTCWPFLPVASSLLFNHFSHSFSLFLTLARSPVQSHSPLPL